MKTTSTFASVTLSLLLLGACQEKKKDSSSVIAGPTAVTSAELIGTYDSGCVSVPASMGTNFTGNKISYMLSIGANESVSLSTVIHTNSSCLGGIIHQADYTGTMTVAGVSSLVSGGSNITFTGNALSMRPYNATVKLWYDRLCQNTATGTFGDNGSASVNVTGLNCNFVSSGMGPASFPASNAVVYTSAIYNSQLSSPTLQMNIGQNPDWIMYPGSGAYPTSVNVTFTKRP